MPQPRTVEYHFATCTTRLEISRRAARSDDGVFAWSSPARPGHFTDLLVGASGGGNRRCCLACPQRVARRRLQARTFSDIRRKVDHTGDGFFVVFVTRRRQSTGSHSQRRLFGLAVFMAARPRCALESPRGRGADRQRLCAWRRASERPRLCGAARGGTPSSCLVKLSEASARPLSGLHGFALKRRQGEGRGTEVALGELVRTEVDPSSPFPVRVMAITRRGPCR